MSAASGATRRFRVRLMDGTDLGEMSELRATQLIRKGVIERGDSIRRVGSNRWRRAEEVAGATFDEMERVAATEHAATAAAHAGPWDPYIASLGEVHHSWPPSTEMPMADAAVPGPAVARGGPPRIGIIGWAIRGIAIVLLPGLLWFGITLMPSLNASEARATHVAAEQRAREAADAVRRFEASGEFKFDPRLDLDSELAKARKAKDWTAKQRARAQAEAAGIRTRVEELERDIAQKPQIESALQWNSAKLAKMKVLAANFEATRAAKEQILRAYLMMGKITAEQYSRGYDDIAVAVAMGRETVGISEQHVRSLESRRAQIERSEIEVLQVRGELSRTADDLPTATRADEEAEARRSVVAAAWVIWKEQISAGSDLAPRSEELRAALASERSARAWGTFAAIVGAMFLVGVHFLLRARGA